MKILNVEAGRAVAAIAVVLFHANASAAHVGLPQLSGIDFLAHGVTFFFVISGFIILHVHQDDIGQPDRFNSFLLKRIIRLYPMLWLIAIPWLVAKTLFAEAPSFEAIGTSLLLYPSTVEPIPLPVWTLRHEALFYAIFALLILHRKAGMLAFGAWFTGVLLQMGAAFTVGATNSALAMALSGYSINFAFGMLVAQYWHRVKRGSIPLILGIIAVAGCYYAESTYSLHRLSTLDYTSAIAMAWPPVVGAAFSLLLLGIVRLEGAFKLPQAVQMLGGASYVLYLVHVPIQTVMQKPLQHFSYAGTALLVLIPVLVSVVLHLYVEKPLTSIMRQRLIPKAKY